MVPGAAERAVSFVRYAPLPLGGRLFGDHVDETGNGLAVSGREAVGHQRCFTEDVRRNGQSQTSAGSVELILHPHSIQNEGLLTEAPTPVALAHTTCRQGNRLLERADRQFS